MLPVGFGAVWLGGWIFGGLVALAAGLMYWEWQGLYGARGQRANVAAAFCGAGPLLFLGAGAEAALIGCLIYVVAVGLAARRTGPLFPAAGFAYIYLACISLVWLRALDPAGLVTVIWLGVAVVMTDSCAYFTGRTLGGPKLAPKISPKKTWSGLIGGIAGAAAGGGVLAAVVDADIGTVVLVSGVLAVVAQIGDLAISKAKRAFDVKDSSNIIPGHGGVLDRFDGILSSSLTMVLLSLAGGNPLLWL